jgi:hypothetical protein
MNRGKWEIHLWMKQDINNITKGRGGAGATRNKLPSTSFAHMRDKKVSFLSCSKLQIFLRSAPISILEPDHEVPCVLHLLLSCVRALFMKCIVANVRTNKQLKALNKLLSSQSPSYIINN